MLRERARDVRLTGTFRFRFFSLLHFSFTLDIPFISLLLRLVSYDLSLFL